MRIDPLIQGSRRPASLGLLRLLAWYASEVVVGICIGLIIGASMIFIGVCCLVAELYFPIEHMACRAWRRLEMRR